MLLASILNVWKMTFLYFSFEKKCSVKIRRCYTDYVYFLTRPINEVKERLEIHKET